VGEAPDLPDELDVVGPRPHRAGPMRVRRPDTAGRGIAVPIRRLTVVGSPTAEGWDSAIRSLGGVVHELPRGFGTSQGSQSRVHFFGTGERKAPCPTRRERRSRR
jgi:hypothetical protein